VSMAGPDVLIEPETVLGIPATLELRQAAIVCPVDLFDAVKIIERTASLRRKGWPALQGRDLSSLPGPAEKECREPLSST